MINYTMYMNSLSNTKNHINIVKFHRRNTTAQHAVRTLFSLQRKSYAS